MVKSVFRVLLALLMGAAGVMHFVTPAPFVDIVPPALPRPELLVYVSGVFELLGALGLLVPRTRTVAAWGVFALLLAVYPANLYQALYPEETWARDFESWTLWVRAALQLPLLAWAYWMTRPDDPSA